MTTDNDLDARLVELVLRQVDAAQDAGGGEPHLDDEILGMLAEGSLQNAELEQVQRHLDVCAVCRRTASVLLSLEPEMVAEVRSRGSAWSVQLGAFVAVAASLLIGVGLLLWYPRQSRQVAENRLYGDVSRLLHERKYREADERLRNARERGIQSDRLRSLQAQSVLEVSGTVALDAAGKLTDFGYEIAGFAARAASGTERAGKLRRAHELLSEVGTESVDARLNLGYVLLAMNRFDEAAALFLTLTQTEPRRPPVWLGLGIARYGQADYPEAEAAFRRCLDLAPEHVAARLNLAMSLEEQGKLRESLETWQRLPLDALSPAERGAVVGEIKNLQRQVPGED